MRFYMLPLFIALACLFLPWSVEAQKEPDRQVEICRNVRLIETAIDPDIPEEIASDYERFLPILEEVLKENIGDQSDECALTIRVTAGFKEVGSAKVKRPLARITAYRRNSTQEYVGNFILYSYLNDDLVNKDETTQFTKRQILDPAECRAKPAEE